MTPMKRPIVMALLVPTIGWALNAVWEWFVMIKSPEANIRVYPHTSLADLEEAIFHIAEERV